jgi:hypothetical protein
MHGASIQSPGLLIGNSLQVDVLLVSTEHPKTGIISMGTLSFSVSDVSQRSPVRAKMTEEAEIIRKM